MTTDATDDRERSGGPGRGPGDGGADGTAGATARAAPPRLRILLAEDDAVSRRLLEWTLQSWGYDVVLAVDGQEAWVALAAPDPPPLAILDWMMPGLDGVEVCRRVRGRPGSTPPYIILLTARTRREDLVEGLEAGADDFITKPFDRDELRARIRVGVRMVTLQRALADRVRDLEAALGRVRQLQGLLPICAYCKKIRDDRNYWQQVEEYVAAHSHAQFSHGICPDCYERILVPQLRALREARAEPGRPAGPAAPEAG
jgi:sigma-B regulation protein RsbU (phosphoserine phosphatase)